MHHWTTLEQPNLAAAPISSTNSAEAMQWINSSSSPFPLLMTCLLLLMLLTVGSVDGKKGHPKKPRHVPKCKSYRPPPSTDESCSHHGGRGHGRVKRIASGSIGDIQEMPWMVYLNASYYYKGLPQYNISAGVRFGTCSATLISPRFVLTVAHCLPVASMRDNDTIEVHYGAANHSEGKVIVRDKYSVRIHPNITQTTDPPFPYPVNTRDMALLELGQDVEFDDNVHSICLSCLYDAYPEGPSIIAGWGYTFAPCVSGHAFILPDVFRYANVSFHPCQVSAFTKADAVCTFADSTHGVNGGDSGGPMLAPVGPRGDYMQMCINGGNSCNPRENACTRIDGKWLKKVTGIECQNYTAAHFGGGTG